MRYFYLMLLSSFFLFSCTNQTENIVTEEPQYSLIRSLEDFQDLVDRNLHPLDKLSENSISQLSSIMVFRDGLLRGFDSQKSFDVLLPELSENEILDLIRVLAGGNVQIVEKGQYKDNIENRSNNSNDPCCPIYVSDQKPVQCSGVVPSECCGPLAPKEEGGCFYYPSCVCYNAC